MVAGRTAQKGEAGGRKRGWPSVISTAYRGAFSTLREDRLCAGALFLLVKGAEQLKSLRAEGRRRRRHWSRFSLLNDFRKVEGWKAEGAMRRTCSDIENHFTPCSIKQAQTIHGGDGLSFLLFYLLIQLNETDHMQFDFVTKRIRRVAAGMIDVKL